MQAWIAGVGWHGFSRTTIHSLFREMMWQSTQRALADAGIDDPRSQLDAVIVCQEDYWEGVSISDEFAPDPTGGVLKPVFTVAGEGLSCLAQSLLLLRSGLFRTVLVESHGKPSDIADLDGLEKLLMDPHLHRPIGLSPLAIAGMDARAFLRKWGIGADFLSHAVAGLLKNGYSSPRWCRESLLDYNDVSSTPVVAEPLRAGMIAPPCDASVSMVVTSDRKVADSSRGGSITLRGAGWSMEASVPLLDTHAWGEAPHVRESLRMAFSSAGLGRGGRVFEWAVVDDRYAYNLFLNLAEIGLAPKSPRGAELVLDYVEGSGGLTVNPMGGLQSSGVPLEASGLALVLEAVESLRSGRLDGRGVVVAWRSFPSLSSTVAILEGGQIA